MSLAPRSGCAWCGGSLNRFPLSVESTRRRDYWGYPLPGRPTSAEWICENGCRVTAIGGNVVPRETQTAEDITPVMY